MNFAESTLAVHSSRVHAGVCGVCLLRRLVENVPGTHFWQQPFELDVHSLSFYHTLLETIIVGGAREYCQLSWSSFAWAGHKRANFQEHSPLFFSMIPDFR